MELIEVLEWYTIPAQEQVIFSKAWCTMSVMKQSSRWFIYHWNVGMWRVWVSLGWINPGNFLLPPTMNLGSLQTVHGKGIHNHHIIDGYRLDTCQDYCRNIWKGSLGIVLCADDEACHVINPGLISQQNSSILCNQWPTYFIWILPLVNIQNSGWIQLWKHSIRPLLGCQHCMLLFILLFRDRTDLPTLGM